MHKLAESEAAAHRRKVVPHVYVKLNKTSKKRNVGCNVGSFMVK
jgi:hypothetical protein